MSEPVNDEIEPNTTILELLKHFYVSATQDEAGCRNGRKGYRMRYDELPELTEKEIGKIVNNLIASQTKTAWVDYTSYLPKDGTPIEVVI